MKRSRIISLRLTNVESGSRIDFFEYALNNFNDSFTLFKHFDKNKDGIMTRTELACSLRELNNECNFLTEKDIMRISIEGDTNSNNSIEYIDFLKILIKYVSEPKILLSDFFYTYWNNLYYTWLYFDKEYCGTIIFSEFMNKLLFHNIKLTRKYREKLKNEITKNEIIIPELFYLYFRKNNDSIKEFIQIFTPINIFNLKKIKIHF